jgi:nitrogen regulatory protein PII
MKKIELIIAAHKVSEVCAALKAIGVTEVATSEVRGDTDADADLAENKLEIIVTAERAAEVIRTFASAGWRELLGDGKIVVYELGDPVRVRTLESRENAR